MDYSKQYQDKLMTPEAAVAIIEDGETIIVPMAIGQPIALINALAGRAKELDATYFGTLDLLPTDMVKVSRDDKLKVDTGYSGLPTRAKVQSGDFTYTPIRILDNKCWEEVRPMEVVMFTASPMDKNGYFTMGPTLDFTCHAMRLAQKIIIEVNEHMPKVHGMGFVHISQVTALIENHRPLLSLPETLAPPDKASELIGQYIADMIEDGSTVQFGLGNIGDSVALALKNKKDLGVHTELISDSIRILWEEGIINNSRKSFMKHVSIASFGFGSQKLYDWIDNNPSIQFHPTGWVNDPYIISKNDKMISVNSALSIDLTGQVNAESFGPLQYGGVGGNLDFVEGAWRSRGGKSFIAFPAAAKKDTVSKIMPIHPAGQAISTGRADVHYVVTEYGVALLKGQSVRERAKRLIAIAHPNFRDELTFEARKLNLI